MATFSSVTRTHVLQALAEYDTRGGDDFLAVYGFEPNPAYSLVHEGRTYDARAVLGVAHRFATGRLATPDEFSSMEGAVAILRRREFDVTEPVAATRPAPARARRTQGTPRGSGSSRTPSTRASAAREVAPKICPTCSMTLPATGLCDNCS